MQIQSAFNAGLEGFNKATEDANQAAANIVAQTTFNNDGENESAENENNIQNSASAPSTPEVQNINNVPSINQSIVDLKVAEFQAKASAEVIQTADQALGTLLDVRV